MGATVLQRHTQMHKKLIEMATVEPTQLSEENARLEALRSFDILDTPPEEIFDEFARLAATVVGTPVGLVSLVDGNRQWFKAKVGLSVDETSRDVAFCAHAIGSNDVFVVPDASIDARFVRNPLVTSGPKIRFYAGAPLITSEGEALGTLCVIDFVPRELTLEQEQALLILSRLVMAQMELRRRLREFTRLGASRLQAAAPLKRALEEDQFVLHYQPKVDLRTGAIVGVEALIRWQSPQFGLVAPNDFIPLLEESGLIIPVGRWVMRQAAADYQDWFLQGLAPPRIAVNVSPLQLRSPTFIFDMTEIMESGLTVEPGLDIEITEGVLIEQFDESVAKLKAARDLGVRVSIDDFGTGYSSLKYLSLLPINSLKIDRSFVSVIAESAGHMAMVSSIIALAHGLDLCVIAEGVETEEQCKLLRLLRCDQMQGHLHSRPMPKEQITAMLMLEMERLDRRSSMNASTPAVEYQGRPAHRT